MYGILQLQKKIRRTAQNPFAGGNDATTRDAAA